MVDKLRHLTPDDFVKKPKSGGNLFGVFIPISSLPDGIGEQAAMDFAVYIQSGPTSQQGETAARNFKAATGYDPGYLLQEARDKNLRS